MDHKGRTRRVAAAALLSLVTSVAFSELRLSDQTSEVYYHYAAVAGAFLQVENEVEITGDLHSNGDVQLKKDSVVTGDVAAVGALVDSQGTVSGTVTEGAPPLGLPAILDEAALRALADRIFEDDELTLTDEVIDDVVFVAGTVRLRGEVSGTGTVIAGGDVRVDSTGQGQGAGGGSPLDPSTRLSLIAVNDIRIGKDRAFRGVLRAGHDVEIEGDVDFEGVAVAGNELHVKQGSSFSFVDFDEVAPVVTLVEPADGSFVATATPRIELAFADDFSGVRAASTAFLLDGADRTAEAAVSAEGLVFTPAEALAEGLHTIEAVIFDHSDNEGRGSFSFTVDTEPPVLTVTSPADGATVTDEVLVVTGTVTDASPIAEVTVNGGPASLAGEDFSATLVLETGANTILVVATDVVGNTSSVSLTVTFAQNTDTEPPTLRIVSPAGGIFLGESRPEIELSYFDDGGVDLDSLTLQVDGAPIQAECSLDQLGGVCTPTSPLPEGEIVLAASLRDLAGNIGTDSVTLTVDTVGVEIAITSPAAGLITRDGTVPVTGTVGEGVTSVRVNDVTASLSGSGFSVIVPLREGINMVVALATKSNGNTGTSSIEVTRDLEAPILKIDTPRDGFVAIQSTITVTGQVNDIVAGGTDPSVFVNGAKAAVGGGTFILADLRLVPGPNVIEAIATDAVGNQGRDAINVTFQPPVGARLLSDSGNSQSESVRATLPQPLVVAVKDDLGNALTGRVVRFEVTRNSGVLRAQAADAPQRVVQVPTDGAGRAAVLFTLGATAGEGNNRVRATSLGVAGEVEFCATGLAAPPDKVLMVGGDNQRGVTGQPLAAPLEALVVDVNGNPIAAVEVTFRVAQGSGTLDGESVLVRTTDLDGIARAVLTLGRNPGINNNVVKATFVGLESLPATFTSSGLAAGDPAQTRFAGVVLDNGQTPIPGARVSIADTDIEAVTDEQGQFELLNVPVGHVGLHVDPTDSPRPEVFPPLAFETVTIAGQKNTLGQPILIPAVDAASAQVVGGDQDVTITMKGVAGLSLTVFANSATFPDGSPTGRLSISQVHLDKVPMMPPGGSTFIPPAWTIQPAGVRFDPPARISIPNDGLPPGRVVDIFQFDHALNQFVDVGKGTVSDDGFLIVSDPGFGITRTGWGGGGQPPPPTSDNEGPECPTEGGQSPLDDPQVVPPPDANRPNHGDGRYSEEGEYRRNRDGTPRPHRGVDLEADVGTDVGAIADGTVILTCPASRCTSSGNQVAIEHADGTVSRYFHLDEINVSEGDSVSAGDNIGTTGTTGNAQGTDAPHLHLEIRDGALTGPSLDPTGCL